MHQHAAATLHHGRHQRAIETNGREQVEIQLLGPAVIAERGKASAWRVGATQGVNDRVNTPDAGSDGVDERLDSGCAGEIGLYIRVYGQSFRPGTARDRHDHRPGVSESLNHGTPGALRAAGDDDAAVPELERIERHRWPQ